MTGQTPEVSEPTPESKIPSVAARLALYQRAGGVITPILTALIAFLIGGLLVYSTTGQNPVSTYKAVFKGSGLSWLSPVSGDLHTFLPNRLDLTGQVNYN